MVLMKSSRMGAYILNVFISMNPWVVASAPTNPVQNSGTATALISPTTGSTIGSMSASQSATSPVTNSSLALSATFSATAASKNASSTKSATSAAVVPRDLLVDTFHPFATWIPKPSDNFSRTYSNVSVANAQTVGDVGIPLIFPPLIPSSATTSMDSLPSTSASSTSNGLPSSTTNSIVPTHTGEAPSRAHLSTMAQALIGSIVAGTAAGAGLTYYFWAMNQAYHYDQRTRQVPARVIWKASKGIFDSECKEEYALWLARRTFVEAAQRAENPENPTPALRPILDVSQLTELRRLDDERYFKALRERGMREDIWAVGSSGTLLQ